MIFKTQSSPKETSHTLEAYVSRWFIRFEANQTNAKFNHIITRSCQRATIHFAIRVELLCYNLHQIHPKSPTGFGRSSSIIFHFRRIGRIVGRTALVMLLTDSIHLSRRREEPVTRKRKSLVLEIPALSSCLLVNER